LKSLSPSPSPYPLLEARVLRLAAHGWLDVVARIAIVDWFNDGSFKADQLLHTFLHWFAAVVGAENETEDGGGLLLIGYLS
jgi:hypothetical protein